MQDIFIQYIFLILFILGLVMLANKMRVAYPIVLVVGGLALSFSSVFSDVHIHPDLIFFLFLPPLLYESAWQVSWKNFWKRRGLILGFAFPIVILTSCVVALVSNHFIPGFTLALGFLLGGIVSPPDAVSASSIMRRVGAPKPLVGILEGECLLNDASSLIVLRFALAAVVTGQFHLQDATFSFAWVIVMGTLIGLGVGFVFYAIHRFLPTTSNIEVVLTLVTPYCMYLAAEHFHFSGVLAVVAGGLFLSSKRESLNYRSRIEASNVWDNLVFALNGFIFLLIGLELPSITRQLGEVSLPRAIGYGLLIWLVLLVTRLACTLGTSAMMTLIGRIFPTVPLSDRSPGWRGPIVFGWAGMRGVVSLAAALSVPTLLREGQPFPQRDLILFITFVVILVTLVFQGLTLPLLMRLIKFEDNPAIAEQKQEIIIQKKLALVSLQFLQENYGPQRAENEHLDNLFSKLELDLKVYERELTEPGATFQNSMEKYQTLYLGMLRKRRELLGAMNNREEFDEELIRKYLILADMEELRMRERSLLESDE